MPRFAQILLACAALALPAAPALAHPHVWVKVTSEILYSPDGSVTGVRHHWAFDEMYSTYATQGLDTNNDGKLSQDELKDLAQTNVEALKDFEYFTYARFDGNKAKFEGASDYSLEHDKGTLTLHFTLPLAAPVKAKSAQFEIYDNTYFVDFALTEGEAVKLTNAPAGCKLRGASKNEPPAAQAPFDGSTFNKPDSAAALGAMSATRIAVNCQ
jgi:ABC-type uncharacterized transport system substrate-binding protein